MGHPYIDLYSLHKVLQNESVCTHPRESVYAPSCAPACEICGHTLESVLEAFRLMYFVGTLLITVYRHRNKLECQHS